MLLDKIKNYQDFHDSTLHHSDISRKSVDKYSAHLETIPKQRVLYTSKEMQSYNNFEISIERWMEIYKMAEKYGYAPQGHIILRYLTDSVMDQFYKSTLKLEVCLPVAKNDADDRNEDESDIYIKEIGGFKAVVSYHYGPYESIHQSHLKMLRYIDKNGYEINGNLCEEYVISPFDLKTDDNYLTKIIYPVS